MGSSPASFSDMGKRAKDLLNKDYNFDHKFTLSMLSSTGMVSTKVTMNDILPCTKAAFSLKIPDHKSGKINELFCKLSSIMLEKHTDPLASYLSWMYNTFIIMQPLNKPDFSAALLLTDKGQALKASYVHAVDSFTCVAAEMTHRFSTFENSFTLGASML